MNVPWSTCAKIEIFLILERFICIIPSIRRENSDQLFHMCAACRNHSSKFPERGLQGGYLGDQSLQQPR